MKNCLPKRFGLGWQHLHLYLISKLAVRAACLQKQTRARHSFLGDGSSCPSADTGECGHGPFWIPPSSLLFQQLEVPLKVSGHAPRTCRTKTSAPLCPLSTSRQWFYCRSLGKLETSTPSLVCKGRCLPAQRLHLLLHQKGRRPKSYLDKASSVAFLSSSLKLVAAKILPVMSLTFLRLALSGTFAILYLVARAIRIRTGPTLSSLRPWESVAAMA